jgi:hypothetical protein
MFTFSEVLRLLSATQGIQDAKEKAFRARLKHLQSLGFPTGTNTGKGRQASYDSWQVCQLQIALEFEQLGMSPDTVVDIMESAHDFIGCMIGDALDVVDRHEPYFLLIDPNALAGKDVDWNASYHTLTSASLPLLVERLSNWQETTGYRRLAMIDLTWVVRELIDTSAAFGDERSGQFRTTLETWVVELRARVVEAGRG